MTPLLRLLNWLPVKQLLYYRDSVLTYKCFKGLAPKHLVDKLTKRSSIHARHTRKRNLLHIPLYRNASGRRTFAYRGTSIWNNLDNNIKAMRFLAVFQASYRRATFRASLFIRVFLFKRILIFLYLLFIIIYF